MSLLKIYLNESSTQAVLRRKVGDEGFSLIELVVVIAVLAALAAIALPNYLGIADDATVRAAQNAAVNSMKECQATWARGKRDADQYFNGHTPTAPAFVNVSEYNVYSTVSNNTNPKDIKSPNDKNIGMRCFHTGDDNKSAPTKKDLVAQPSLAGKYPTFVVRVNGYRACSSGDASKFPDTFNLGCSGKSLTFGTWE